MVRAGCVHRLHGDLRDGGGGQAGLQPGDAEAAVLQAALYTRLRVIHQGPLRHLLRPLVSLHPRQLPGGLQSLSR